ncbi:MAG: hypothetical protein A2W31_07890 [Planctomycetes bacterium RBG_16_64_10]|nr:MAG: hypothetical protein A2W31_07890 [Planctomycetes bacterium RBG_16_64_10]
MEPLRANAVGGLVLAALTTWTACTGPVVRPAAIDDFAPLESTVTLIGDLARPYGLNYVKVEGVSLVTGLAGTGADPAPGPQRAVLLAEMQCRGIENPAQILASSDTALVLVRGFLRPGIQKGDRFDVEVRVPSRSEVQSLRNGWLLTTRLSELAVLGQQIRRGHLLATAAGPLLVDPTAAGARDRPLLTQCQVLGGGVCAKSRSLGLAIDTEHRSVQTSQAIGKAINLRFHTHVDRAKQGVATPKTDQFVELLVHPRYKDNISRYMHVIRSIALDETATQRQERLELLAQQLADPVSAATAAQRLEAIGTDAAETLKKALHVADQDPEVRFYAAEALAYLDDSDAVATLAACARDEPAFRLYALTALSAMDDVAAVDALRDMLSARSGETRYGAFRALTAMDKDHPAVRGEMLGDQFNYHVLNVEGPAMIHVTRSYRPEVVLFGRDLAFKLPVMLDAGRHIMVNGRGGSEITVSRFAAEEGDQKRVVSAQVDAVIRAVVDLGGTYPDVVQMLTEAKESGTLTCRFRTDALPKSGRSVRRADATGDEPELEEDLPTVANPIPDLFRRWRTGGSGKEEQG